MSNRCPPLITFSQCCKVRLTAMGETSLSAAALSPGEEIELLCVELWVHFVE